MENVAYSLTKSKYLIEVKEVNIWWFWWTQFGDANFAFLEYMVLIITLLHWHIMLPNTLSTSHGWGYGIDCSYSLNVIHFQWGHLGISKDMNFSKKSQYNDWSLSFPGWKSGNNFMSVRGFYCCMHFMCSFRFQTPFFMPKRKRYDPFVMIGFWFFL